MVGKVRKILVIIGAVTFLFSLPMVLSNFIHLGLIIQEWMVYYFIYTVLSVCFIVLFVVLFFVSFITDKDYINMMLSVCGTVSAVLVIMFIMHIAIFLSYEGKGKKHDKFDSVKWQKADGNRLERKYMLKDLVEKILPGKTAEEAINLLGDPYRIISEGKVYYSYPVTDDKETMFRINYRDENGNITSYELIDKKSLYDSVIMKGSEIYYITGPSLIDYETLEIYFDENGLFKEYKLGSS